MDNAVALVQAYLHVNGYFTVAEYPIVEPSEHGHFRAVTDLDILAFRFPDAGRLISGGIGGARSHRFEVDSALGVAAGTADMIIGEVKEGRGMLNRVALDRSVIEAALLRFGCCSDTDSRQVVDSLVRAGRADLASGHQLRLVLFASTLDSSQPAVHKLSLGHVVRYLQDYLRQHWSVLHAAQFKDPAFGFLATLEKALRATVTPASRS